MAINITELHNLGWSYGSQQVFDSVSTGFPAGKLSCIIGPNGSGKTTLLKCLLRLFPVPKGSVFYEGKESFTFSRKEIARFAAYVPQNFAVNFDYTVSDIVESGRYPYFSRFKGISAEDTKVIHSALEQTEILHLSEKNIRQLSGGEAQRVIIARALAQQPKLICFDEPIAHLDIHHQIQIFQLIRHLVDKMNLTVITVIHDLNFVLAYADHVFVLHDHKLYTQGQPEDVITSELCSKVFNIKGQIEQVKKTGRKILLPEY